MHSNFDVTSINLKHGRNFTHPIFTELTVRQMLSIIYFDQISSDERYIYIYIYTNTNLDLPICILKWVE